MDAIAKYLYRSSLVELKPLITCKFKPKASFDPCVYVITYGY